MFAHASGFSWDEGPGAVANLPDRDAVCVVAASSGTARRGAYDHTQGMVTLLTVTAPRRLVDRADDRFGFSWLRPLEEAKVRAGSVCPRTTQGPSIPRGQPGAVTGSAASNLS